MTVTEQNHLLVFDRRILRKIYGPTLDSDGTWRIKTNEELETLINPLPVQFTALLHGQKGWVFFSGHLNLRTAPETGLPSRKKKS